jgi:putative ABC transport system substrate-binding protein
VKRRLFVEVLAGGAIFPAAVRAQPAGPLPHIAFLGVQSSAAQDPRQIEQFKAGLVENKLIDGTNVVAEYYFADGSADRLRELTKALAARKDIAVVITVGQQSVRDLLAAGSRTPIVMAVMGDPLASGFVQSLSRPGGTVTGLSMSNVELEGKRLELLKAAVPAVTRVMVLHEVSQRAEGLEGVRQVAAAIGVETLAIGVAKAEEFEGAFAAAVGKGANGLAVMASPFLNFRRKQLIELANRHRLPSVWEADIFALDGGLMSYGPSFVQMYRRSAIYVAKILRGAQPGDLPVEQPTHFDLVVNQRTARLLGLTLPAAFLARADDVIE